MEDSRIVALFFECSEQAIGELDRKYGAQARRLAMNILADRSDAEECVNDAFFAAWSSIPPQLPSSLGGYFCRIARNIAAKRYRANTAQKRNSFYDAALDELAGSLTAPGGPESALDAKELTAAIDRFLDGLSDGDRVLFLRRYWFGDDLAAVAARAGMSPRRASVRLFRIREKLKQYLMKEGAL